MHPPPLAGGRDQPGAAQQLQVPGGIGEGQSGPFGKGLHAVLALPEMLQEFDAMGVAEPLRDPGEHRVRRRPPHPHRHPLLWAQLQHSEPVLRRQRRGDARF